jgi:hypothetical protein
MGPSAHPSQLKERRLGTPRPPTTTPLQGDPHLEQVMGIAQNQAGKGRRGTLLAGRNLKEQGSRPRSRRLQQLPVLVVPTRGDSVQVRPRQSRVATSLQTQPNTSIMQHTGPGCLGSRPASVHAIHALPNPRTSRRTELPMRCRRLATSIGRSRAT